MTANAVDSAKTYDSWAVDYYQPAALPHYDQSIARMLRFLNPSPGSTVLDAGCGTGVHSIRVAKAGYPVRAIDISAVAIDRARQNAIRAGVAVQIMFEQADLTHLPFDDAMFEAVFTWGVVTHIPEIEVALSELVRVTRPGGRIAVQITNGGALDHKVEAVARFLLNKPEVGQGRYPMGVGGWCDMHGGRLWNWKTDVPAMIRAMRSRQCMCIGRFASEFTEIQRRVGGPLRGLLRHANDLYFRWRLPAAGACTNLVVFRKSA